MLVFTLKLEKVLLLSVDIRTIIFDNYCDNFFLSLSYC